MGSSEWSEGSTFVEIRGANGSVIGSSNGTDRPHSDSGEFHMLEPIVQLIIMSDDHTLVEDDINFVMKRLFFEDDSVPASGSLQHSGMTPPLPKLKNLDHFFSKLS